MQVDRRDDSPRRRKKPVTNDAEGRGRALSSAGIGEDEMRRNRDAPVGRRQENFGEKWCAVSMTPQAYEYRISGTKARLMLGAEPLDLVKLSD